MLRLCSILIKERIYEPTSPKETTLRPGLSTGPAGASRLLPVPAMSGLPVSRTRIPLLGKGWPLPPNYRLLLYPVKMCPISAYLCYFANLYVQYVYTCLS